MTNKVPCLTLWPTKFPVSRDSIRRKVYKGSYVTLWSVVFPLQNNNVKRQPKSVPGITQVLYQVTVPYFRRLYQKFNWGFVRVRLWRKFPSTLSSRNSTRLIGRGISQRTSYCSVIREDWHVKGVYLNFPFSDWTQVWDGVRSVRWISFTRLVWLGVKGRDIVQLLQPS